MTDNTWEARQAARAHERAADALSRQRAIDQDSWERHIARIERLGQESRAGMTLGEAIRLLAAPPTVCACVGAPHCCRFSYEQARALHRGAHITAKLVAALAEQWDGPSGSTR